MTLPAVEQARLLDTILVRRGPIGAIAVGDAGATIIATNSGDNSVSVLDADSLTVDGVVPVAGEPFAVTSAAGHAFVGASMPTYESVSAVDPHAKTCLASLALDQHAAVIAASHDGGRLFVAGTGDQSAELAIIDVETGRTDTVEIPVGVAGTVDAVRLAPNNRLVYVATSDTDRGHLTTIDVAERRVVAGVATVSPIRDVVLSADGSVAYVLGRDPEYGGVVETIDPRTRRLLATAWIGGSPTQFALGADGNRLYIVDVDHVAVLCLITNEVVDTISVGAHPSCVAASPDGARLFVADYSGALTVFAVAPPSFDDVIDVQTDALSEVRELEPAGA